ncbi:hypothetical protein [Candidatus Oscillochloris fontis]|uniref:hypothetical protein n=1 Tax=Candidatus Oscillochloris fontis TaxID=2496868 RepID=UPI00101DCFA7|nr:hypothetical protein [Candidatus Oscillochloris fontis]
MSLPISRITIYKHGVGYFERRGPLTGESLRLTFAREAMDDVLKSLVALDLGTGQVQSVDFETPEDRATILERGSIHLSDNQSMLDLLRDLRGRQVALVLDVEGEIRVEGLVVGVDYEADEPLRRAIVSIYDLETHHVRALPVAELARVDLLDPAAVADLNFFLRAAQSEEDRRSATIHLSPGEHDLLVGYIAPAPAWRVSYRLLYEEPKDEQAKGGCLLQGWGIFDNQLDEDLEGVELTLVAGMPISFRYRLYEPHTPERPLVEDEERTVGAPIFFDAAPEPAPMVAEMAFGAAPPAPMMTPAPAGAMRSMAAPSDRFSAKEMEESVEISAKGDERGALFAYKVGHPVSVARGQSAMVPIVSKRLPASRDLLYNKAKLPDHPVASLRLLNETGLTLERGPVTVLDDGDYAGEAVLPFTRAGGELIVPYAVELGIKVHEKVLNHRRMHAVRIRGEYAVYEEYDIRTRYYEIVSGLDKPAEVMIEHARLANYDLDNTRPPDEESPGFARWRVPCPTHGQSKFAVTERQLVSRQEHVRNLNAGRLKVLLKDGLLDPKTVQFLEGILTLYQKIEATKAEIRKVEQEREAIYKQQRQIQGNLQPLGREGDEGTLRQRYVTTLNQLEDGLISLSKREEALNQQIATLEAKIKQLLGV